MSHMSLIDIDTIRANIEHREKTLPGYWGERSEGTQALTQSYQQALDSKSRYESHSQSVKDSLARASAFARLAKRALEECGKTPAQSFAHYNTAALILQRGLDSGEPVEQALQKAQRKSHSLANVAKSDGAHWFRKTETWKKIYQNSL